MVRNPPANEGDIGDVGSIPEWQPTTVFLLGKFHRQRNLQSYSSWGGKKLDMTKQLNTHTQTSMLIMAFFRALSACGSRCGGPAH